MVITIMVMLMAITLPAVKQVIKDSGTREASRQLNAYFAMAKARALLTGRPCGVMMRCDLPIGIGPDPGGSLSSMPDWPARQVTQLYLAEVPPPYAGGSSNSRGRIKISPILPATYEFIPTDTNEILYLAGLIELGERFTIRFDYKGPWYVCQRQRDRNGNEHFIYQSPGDPTNGILPVGIGVSPNNQGITSTGSVTPLPPGMSDPNPAHPGYTFQITRLPRRIGNPLELPAGTCIDLAYSGIGPTNLPTGMLRAGMYPGPPVLSSPSNFPGLFTSSPVKLEYLTVMFQPDGGIDSVYLNNFSFAPPSTVHFLVGKTERIRQPTGNSSHPAGKNIFDPESSNLPPATSIPATTPRPRSTAAR
jgi:hypothetical protein